MQRHAGGRYRCLLFAVRGQTRGAVEFHCFSSLRDFVQRSARLPHFKMVFCGRILFRSIAEMHAAPWKLIRSSQHRVMMQQVHVVAHMISFAVFVFVCVCVCACVCVYVFGKTWTP